MAVPRNIGIENSKAGELAIGRTVPQAAQLSIHWPWRPSNAVGRTKARMAPITRAVIHFILGQHSQRVFDEALKGLHQPGAVGAVDGAVVEAAGRRHDGRDLKTVVDD